MAFSHCGSAQMHTAIQKFGGVAHSEGDSSAQPQCVGRCLAAEPCTENEPDNAVHRSECMGPFVRRATGGRVLSLGAVSGHLAMSKWARRTVRRVSLRHTTYGAYNLQQCSNVVRHGGLSGIG